jgi:two-component system, NtrC family, sensor kinase
MINPALPKNRRVLVIDDNQAIHADFRKILQASDELSAGLDATEAVLFEESTPRVQPIYFDLHSAMNGQDGLAKVREAIATSHPYALAFVDMRMPPGWDGIETIAHIYEIDPGIQIVLCTAYSDYTWEEIIKQLGSSDRLVILKKPFDNVEVMQLAHALTEKWDLRQKAGVRMGQLEEMVTARTHELQAANEQLKIEMAERARTEEALIQAQKMEALGQLAGGVAHDFNNLITVIRGYAQCLISAGNQSATALEALRQVDGAAERAAKLTAQLLMFSRKKRLQPQCLDLGEVTVHLSKMLRRLIGEDVTMRIECPDTAMVVHADRAMIEQIIMNLAVNARDAMPQGGRLLIQTGEKEITEENVRRNPKARLGRFACLNVSDTGCGIAPQVLAHLFEPFFTTKEPGKGTGLGLATVYGIVKQHEGWVEVESEPGNGTAFKVFLPLSSKTAELAVSLEAETKITGGSETILLVEDEPAVRRLARGILLRHGYRVYEAGSGVEALSVWKEHGAEVELLLTDMVMPGGLSGRELARRLRETKSNLKVAYTTGYSLDAMAKDCALQEGLNFLPKPYSPQKLAQIVRHCLDEPSPLQLCELDHKNHE